MQMTQTKPATMLAYGIGVDSTALLIELIEKGEAPDLILTADTGSEKPETYAYLTTIKGWLARHGRRIDVVRYQPRRFKHWPPYYSLIENALTNSALPSISLGRHSCSLKWKISPQNAFVEQWEPARVTWSRGQRVHRYIGYDASPQDSKRYAHAEGFDDPRYLNVYPLREWGWTRSDCEDRIRRAGLAVPVKSACFMCAAAKPDEIRALPKWCLRIIVLTEARAAPRLRAVEGLWRTSTKTRPGRMTDFIADEQLLCRAEIEEIATSGSASMTAFQNAAADVPVCDRPALGTWIANFLQKQEQRHDGHWQNTHRNNCQT